MLATKDDDERSIRGGLGDLHLANRAALGGFADLRRGDEGLPGQPIDPLIEIGFREKLLRRDPQWFGSDIETQHHAPAIGGLAYRGLGQ